MTDRLFSTPMSFLRMESPRGSTARCTMRLGTRLTGSTMDSIGGKIDILCHDLTAMA